MPRSRLLLGAGLLVLLTLCAYYPATQAGYIWDDNEHFVNDSLLTEPGGLYRIWFNPDKSVWNYWPISRTSFWIERRLWGLDATASHIVNIILHLASALILYFGLHRFRVPFPWFIAALFALHPFLVESVTWLTERKNVLSGVFYLSCIWSYLSFDETRNRWRCYALALLLFACALLSKSSTIMLPVILIICRFAFQKPWTRRDVLHLVPFFLLSMASAMVSIWFEENSLGSTGPDFDATFAQRIAVAGRIPFFYLSKLLFPWPLMFFYPKWQVDAGHLVSFLPALGLGVLAFVFLLNYRRWGRYPTLVLAAFLVTLFPVLGFFDIYGMRYTYVAAHWAYLPAVPILLAAGVGIGKLLGNSRRTRWTVFGIILLACGITSWRHNHVFENHETLWRDTLARNPDCWLAHNNLGVERLRQGRAEEALTHLLENLRLKPDHPYVHYGLAQAYELQGQSDKVIEHLNEALKSESTRARAHYELGLLLTNQGRLDDGINHLLAAIDLQPDQNDVHLDIGRAYSNKGQIDKAIEHYTAALDSDHARERALHQLGLILKEQGRLDEARQHFLAVIEINPQSVPARVAIGNCLVVQNRLDEAVELFLAALEINPNDASIHNNIGVACLIKGDVAGAIRHLREAIRLQPDFPEAEDNLRRAMTQQNQAPSRRS